MGWIKRAWSKVSTRKPRPFEDQVWKRLQDPALGMQIFAIVPIIIVATDIVTTYPDDFTWAQLFQKLTGWQTLLAGTLAILASVFAARAVVVQTASAELAEQKRLDMAAAEKELATTRALVAARSVMPMSLNALAEYAEAVAEASMTVLDRSPGRRVRLTADRMPPLPHAPSETVPSLQAFILAAPMEMGPYVADLLSDVQILSASVSSVWRRTLGDEGQIVFQDNYRDLIARAAVLHARIAELYPFARRDTEVVPSMPRHEDVHTALRLWRVFRETEGDIYDRADLFFRRVKPSVL